MNAPTRLGSMIVAVSLLMLAACTAGGAPAPSPTPSPTPSPSPSPTVSQASLKYALLARFGPISWCDPDYYPIAHEDEQVLAEQRLPAIQADVESFAAIRQHLGLDTAKAVTDADKLAIYREWKLLNAATLTPAADGSFVFDLITETNVGLGEGVHTTGVIDAQGNITITVQEDSFLTSCPICLSRGTLIDTPNGPVAVEQLSVGDLVWTVDAAGRRVTMPLLQVGLTTVLASHRVVHIVLDDGRKLWVSPGHPLADGRMAEELHLMDPVDGARVVTVELVNYAGGATFDILPDGATGHYWANGILLGSTLS